MKDLVIPIPQVTASVTIKADWIEKRDKLIQDANEFSVVTDQTEYELVSEVLREITKTSNALESMRKDLTEPFRNAGTLIKDAADTARAPLEFAKGQLKGILSNYAIEQQRKADEERQRIEQEERKAREAAEKALAEQQKLKDAGRMAEAEAIVLPPVVVVQPQVEEAKASTTRVSRRVIWEVLNEKKVPEIFKTLDPKKINGWLKMSQDMVKDKLNIGSEGTDIIPGLLFKIETSVAAR